MKHIYVMTKGLINKIKREVKRFEKENHQTLRGAWESSGHGITIHWYGETYSVYGNGKVYIWLMGNASEYAEYLGTLDL